MSFASRVALLSLLLPLGIAAPARSDESDDQRDPFEISLSGSGGIPNGYVQVRENERVGTRLRFHHDLGMDDVESIALSGAYHLTSDDAFRLEFDTLFLYGSTRLDEDVFFNGARLQGGTRLRSEPDFFRLTGLYERRLFDLPGGGHLAGDLGITYVLLEFSTRGTLSSLSAGSETKEDFLTQELPVPMLGFSFEQPLSKRLRFVGTAFGGYLPKVDSLRTEGGTVYLKQSHADASARLRYVLLPHLDLEGGYAFHYFMQNERSREDGNFIKLYSNDLTAGLTYRF